MLLLQCCSALPFGHQHPPQLPALTLGMVVLLMGTLQPGDPKEQASEEEEGSACSQLGMGCRGLMHVKKCQPKNRSPPTVC